MAATNEGAAEPAVLVRQQGRAGRITLNRPRSLNALDPAMIERIEAALLHWRDDPAVHLVVLDAAGDRAFCAGGDVRTIREWSLAGNADAIEHFFVREYALNRLIARYPKPYVSLIDGLWMGGGVGLSVHGAVRVVGERAVFAMPEVQVGLFPDVGASYVLPRLRGAFGPFLGLTGTRVGAGDACRLGLATHFVPSAGFAGLAESLAEEGIGALADRVAPPPAGPLLDLRDAIASVFTLDGIAAIEAALDNLDAEWARSALEAMRAASPTSLRWTLDLLRAGAGRTFEQCQQAELELTRVATRFADFAEGVRAHVVEKDRTPRWASVS